MLFLLILQLLVALYVLSYVAQWFSGITLTFTGKYFDKLSSKALSIALRSHLGTIER